MLPSQSNNSSWHLTLRADVFHNEWAGYILLILFFFVDLCLHKSQLLGSVASVLVFLVVGVRLVGFVCGFCLD